MCSLRAGHIRNRWTAYLYLGRVAIAHFAAGNMPDAHRQLAVSHLGTCTSGGLAEARAIAGDLMRLEPEFRLATFARRRQPFRQPETGAAYLEGLRAAGLPD